MTGGRRTGGVAVVEALAAHGVDTVFGIPGTHNLEIYRGLTACGVRHVTPRHEQGGGYAADAMARTTGRPGVMITTTGPGLTNVMTAAATAYADSVPLVVVSPGLPEHVRGRDVGWLHETKDQSASMDSLVVWSRRAHDADHAIELVHEAFAHQERDRPGPVHVEVPVDVLEAQWSGTVSTPARAVAEPPLDAEIDAAARVLDDASNVMMVVGGGARGAVEQVRRVAEALDAPVLTTCNGKGVLPEDHPLGVGAHLRLAQTWEALRAADVVLVVGSELGDSDTWGHDPAGLPVVRVDVDPDQRDKNAEARAAVVGDAAVCLDRLLDRLQPRARAEGADGGVQRARRLREACLAQAREDDPVSAEVVQAVSAAVPDDVPVAGDSSQVTYYGAVHHLRARRPGRLLYMPGYATLGYALPAAIGGSVSRGDGPSVALVGDGAFMFSVQELMTAVENDLPVVTVVLDNGGYREIRDGMDSRGIPRLGVDLRRPDVVALAQAFGALGERVDEPAQLTAAVERACAAGRPTVIHLPIP